MTAAADLRFMQRAFELARSGLALASPNPHVGAVIVDSEGHIVGEGTHTYEGVKHAEILALEQAGERARGATLYLNLEPCCHQGRTGPCVDAVIAAGISRVVAAMSDPNPRVSGEGFKRLRKAGIKVSRGKAEAEARKLNEAFANWIRTRRPLVTLKSAMTLDGRIAPPPGESRNPTALGAAGASRGWITSDAARAHVQELRHASDAILIGVGTAIADDPQLTDRTGRPRRRPLLRVVLDSRLRLPLHSRLVKSAHDDLLVFCADARPERKRDLEKRGVAVEQICNTGRPQLKAVVEALGQREITSLMIEGGSQINGAALAEDIAAKVFFYYAPKIFGSIEAVPYAAPFSYDRSHTAAQVRCVTLHRFGEDFAVEGYLKDPYASS